MANELNWLRSKAKHLGTETMVVTPAEASEAECEAGTYQIERFGFSGTLPVRMAKALRASELTKTDTENETLRLGNGFRSGLGQCEYYRSVYTRVAA